MSCLVDSRAVGLIMHVSANHEYVSNDEQISMSAVSTTFDAVLMGCVIASHCSPGS